MSKNTIRIGIAGGAGYTGGELLRILVNHPHAEIVFVHSKSSAGKYIHEIHNDLLGDTDLKFSGDLSQDIDVLFLCVGHGEGIKFISENKINDNIKIIDLSQDFRLKPQTADLKQQTSNRHFTYGLPELNRKEIEASKNIANPGCFATCIQLGLLPLAFAGKLNEVHVSAITGSTGAGQSLSATSHFSWRNNNLSVYKAFTHQHLKEIRQSVVQLQSSFNEKINFIPYRGDFTRGIMASLYTKSDLTLEQAHELYQKYYQSHPFVTVSKVNTDLKQVVNTNKCILYLEKHDDTLLIISIIDNLTKGASGQAVQNMNLMFKLDEDSGLRLKPVGF